ncbi:MAG: hypothetical protein GC162_20460 [Planctomycetes bacterium]|nr:hypothetical protein [Planctomycetota bacterium]
MSDMHCPIDERIAELIVRYLDHSINEQELADLQQALADDPQAMLYFRIATMAASNIAARPIAGKRTILETHAIRSSRRATLVRTGMAIAAMIALMLLGWFAMLPKSQKANKPDPTRGLTVSGVALLSDFSKDAVFADANQPRSLGASLPVGRLSLTAGTAQVMFNSTAVVDLTGPCDFQMTEPNRGRLMSGALAAFVPQGAHGFTVDLPDGLRVIDLGTRFAVNLHDSTVRVDEGQIRVIWEKRGVDTRLSAGTEFRFADDKADVLTPMPLADGGFELGGKMTGDTAVVSDLPAGKWLPVQPDSTVSITGGDRGLRARSGKTMLGFYGSGRVREPRGVQRVVSTERGRSYELRFYLARQTNRNVPSIDVDVFDGLPSASTEQLSVLAHQTFQADGPAETWTDAQTIRFTARSQTTTLRFTESPKSDTAGVDPFLDDVSFYLVNEPARTDSSNGADTPDSKREQSK